MKTIMVCIETDKKTKIALTKNEPWTNDNILSTSANGLLKREPEHKYDYVTIRADKMRSEIYHAVGDLAEHTGEYRTFKIVRR